MVYYITEYNVISTKASSVVLCLLSLIEKKSISNAAKLFVKCQLKASHSRLKPLKVLSLEKGRVCSVAAPSATTPTSPPAASRTTTLLEAVPTPMPALLARPRLGLIKY